MFTFPLAKQPPEVFMTNDAWVAYQIPEGASLLMVALVGAGGNGGQGFARTAGSAGGGGGGGGSGSLTRVLFPVAQLPGTIFIRTGSGASANSYLGILPNTAAGYLLALSGGGFSGGNGTGAAVGAAGSGGSASVLAAANLQGLGNYSLGSGQAGSPGGAIAGAVGSSIVWNASGALLSGGAGGGGSTSADFAGGQVTGVAGLTPDILGGISGDPDGAFGFTRISPLFGMGGGGGAAINAGVAGRGGNGGVGSGGGGGGAGVTAGGGGNGGPGICLIWPIFG